MKPTFIHLQTPNRWGRMPKNSKSVLPAGVAPPMDLSPQVLRGHVGTLGAEATASLKVRYCVEASDSVAWLGAFTLYGNCRVKSHFELSEVYGVDWCRFSERTWLVHSGQCSSRLSMMLRKWNKWMPYPAKLYLLQLRISERSLGYSSRRYGVFHSARHSSLALGWHGVRQMDGIDDQPYGVNPLQIDYGLH